MAAPNMCRNLQASAAGAQVITGSCARFTRRLLCQLSYTGGDSNMAAETTTDARKACLSGGFIVSMGGQRLGASPDTVRVCAVV